MWRRVLGALAAASAFLVSWVAVSQPGSSEPPAPPPVQLLGSSFSSGFVAAPEEPEGRYVLRHRRASALFTETGMALSLPSRARPSRELGWSVAGGRSVRPQVRKPREAMLLQRVGPSGTEAREVPTYGGLRYPGVLPGVELWFEERAEGVEYGFRAERGADLRRVTLEYAGAREVRVVEEGRALEVDLGEGVLREEGLHCAQEDASGFLRAVGCRYTDAHPVGREQWAYSLEVDVEDLERPVVVDPVIRWNDYFGVQGTELFGDMVRSDSGEVFIVGTLPRDAYNSTPFPQGIPGQRGVLVARFEEDGGLGAWTVISGQSDSTGGAIALGNRKLYIAGGTNSGNYGTIPINRGAEGSDDGFVAQLDPSTLKADWIFLLGSDAGTDTIHDLAVGTAGELLVVGATNSLNFPNAPVATIQKGLDAFITRLDPTVDGGSAGFDRFNLATVRWSTVLRGANDDQANAIAVGEGGSVYVTGGTSSSDLLASPKTPHDKHQGGADIFAVRLEPDAGRGEASLYLGGKGEDEGRALVVRPSTHSLFIAGTTSSERLPDGGSLSGASSNAFLVDLQRETFLPQGMLVLGGEGDDVGRTVTLSNDDLYLGGTTFSPDFPVTGGFDTDFGVGSKEGFVARVTKAAGPGDPVVQWSSWVGGSGEDEVFALQGDGQGRLFIGGTSTSLDLVPSGVPSTSYPRSQGSGEAGGLFLMLVDPEATAPDAGPVLDGGTDAGVDGGTDAGTDGGADGGTSTGPDAGLAGPASPLGWSCGASGSSGGALVLGSLVGLVLLVSRRKRATSGP